ncbi:MAG: GNAT family N-acetyltransferase [Atopococcus tabaci]|uniref:GNAT family N-acetyltransferase n=1 Tax=Atopococcus tabaci TaxID=269774 RepID=A0AA43RKC4_9LACT|nr:GNAT family N-acetyltransferase [Atopococcus tabaci]
MYDFKSTYLFSSVVTQTPYFTQYYQAKMPDVRQTNFMSFHFNPILENFQFLESFQKDFHQDTDQSFLRFHWPQDEGIYPEIFSYLHENNYQLGRMELLKINPQDFMMSSSQPEITITSLNKNNMEDYLNLNYEADLEHGRIYAEQKQIQYQGYLKRPHIQPYLAFHNNHLVASIDLIVLKSSIEINSLYVAPKYRRQGIASALQEKAVEIAEEHKSVLILIADAEDTPIDMYEEQGYDSLHSIIIAEKQL